MDINPDNLNSVTLTAIWIKSSFDYTGGQQTFKVPYTGYYKLEAWGAQGGTYFWGRGGYGGYSVGVSRLTASQTLYVNVGGQGIAPTLNAEGNGVYADGGYNGGGKIPYSNHTDGASGGGATHIATVSGELNALAGYRNTGGTNISNEILIVAGGGGGTGAIGAESNPVAHGGEGGGYQGAVGHSLWGSDDDVTNEGNGSPGTQISGGAANPFNSDLDQYTAATPGAFGLGGDGGSTVGSGLGASGAGGGGWYGGGGGFICSGGGGSGYIGSSNLFSSSGITKHMYCFECGADQSNSSYRTVVGQDIGHAVANAANTGNGYARITYLGTSI